MCRVLELVKEIKNKYIEKTNNYKNLTFKDWVKELNEKKYNDIMDGLEVNQYKNLVLFRYGQDCFKIVDLWNVFDGIYRECRSIVIDINTMEIVILPFDKFFNLGELEENSLENIQKEIARAKSIEITNKMDGSMQCLRYYNGDYILTGSQAISETTSWRLKKSREFLTYNIRVMAKENPNLTFIFEYIDLDDAKIVKYSKEDEGLYLIGIRDVKTLRQYSYKEVSKIATKYQVNMTIIENKHFNEILEEVKNIKGYYKEGWVINIDGHLIKLKGDDYVGLHRILSKLCKHSVVIENICNGTLDDLLSKIPILHRDGLINLAKEIIGYKEIVEKQIEFFYDKAPVERVEFFRYINTLPKHLRGFLGNKYNNKPYEILRNYHGKCIKLKSLKEWSEIECQDYL
ncbi:MAG: T4 RnlA family RNA ligase [Sarcina sp.]